MFYTAKTCASIVDDKNVIIILIILLRILEYNERNKNNSNKIKLLLGMKYYE